MGGPQSLLCLDLVTPSQLQIARDVDAEAPARELLRVVVSK